MRKPLVYTAALACSFIVGCQGHSKSTASRSIRSAREGAAGSTSSASRWVYVPVYPNNDGTAVVSGLSSPTAARGKGRVRIEVSSPNALVSEESHGVWSPAKPATTRPTSRPTTSSTKRDLRKIMRSPDESVVKIYVAKEKTNP